jgi:hypothetical protein
VSEAQVAWAVAVQSKMIREATDRSDFDRKVILSAIDDATWFCAHENKAYDELRRPTFERLAEGGRS